MLETIKQPANRAMLATQQQAHYSGDYDRRANDRADDHSRLVQKCRKRPEGWDGKGFSFTTREIAAGVSEL